MTLENPAERMDHSAVRYNTCAMLTGLPLGSQLGQVYAVDLCVFQRS